VKQLQPVVNLSVYILICYLSSNFQELVTPVIAYQFELDKKKFSMNNRFKLLLVTDTKTVQSMSVAPNNDSLRALAEKLKQLTDDTQEQYEAFVDASQHYKKGNVNQKDFLAKLADYLIGMTSLNFIAIQVLFEVKSSIQTSLSKKSPIAVASETDRDTEKVGLVDDRNRPTGVGTDTTQMKPFSNPSKSAKVKNCIVCGSTIPGPAKFCNKCGNSQ
jgi:O-phosphoseryl-tRNA(Cys) synthetase